VIRFNFPTFIFQIINFIVTLYLIYRFAYKPLASYIERRQKNIKSGLDEIEKEKGNLESLQIQYETQLKEVQKQAEEIIEKAKQQAEVERARTIERAHREAQSLVEKAQNEILLERKHTIERFKEEIVGIILDTTTKLIKDEVSTQEELKEKVFEKYLKDVSSINE